MDSHHPPWLKSIQNGTIGEARTRAFLIDRFWILERSVDVQGADFIIQRRLTSSNLLDQRAPRFGVVQSKFFGTPSTQHRVHKEYAVDDRGSPRTEFFLVAHVGDASNASTYVVSGKELAEHFEIREHEGTEKYLVTLERLASSDRFLVRDPARTLERMDRQLELAEFTKNRAFMSWALPSASLALGAIEPVYREPIDNWWGDIPSAFESIKRTAQRAMLHVHEVYDLLDRFVQETDPLAAADLIGEVGYYCRSGLGRWSISLPDDLDDRDFFAVCRRHRRMVDKLVADGLLDRFLAIKSVLRAHVVDHLGPQLPMGPDRVHILTIEYDPQTFGVAKVTSYFDDLSVILPSCQTRDRWGRIEIEMDQLQATAQSRLGRVEVRWLPEREHFPAPDGASAIDTLRSADLSLYRECMDIMFELRYGQDDGA